ncbi:MAG TPA: hypothetical protein VHV10_04530 [Ktedonobacteraceae bacterium]|nr:hypothetical protein [Ktedonobacteraceae bacterium]
MMTFNQYALKNIRIDQDNNGLFCQVPDQSGEWMTVRCVESKTSVFASHCSCRTFSKKQSCNHVDLVQAYWNKIYKVEPVQQQPAPPTGGGQPSGGGQPAPPPTGVNGNPWGYDFNPGSLIYNPNSGFCSYFNCVSTFWTATNGYVAECGNGKYTHSDGVKGACSKDSGVSKVLYQHP